MKKTILTKEGRGASRAPLWTGGEKNHINPAKCLSQGKRRAPRVSVECPKHSHRQEKRRRREHRGCSCRMSLKIHLCRPKLWEREAGGVAFQKFRSGPTLRVSRGEEPVIQGGGGKKMDLPRVLKASTRGGGLRGSNQLPR